MSPNPPTSCRFILNDQLIDTTAPAGMLVLDYLRRRQHQTGTKEGCREGDCGACTVLIGELNDGVVSYRPVTSCLMPLGEVDGKHLVTIEGLQLEALTPIQQAIVEEGATQCGFCTPGIVVSMTALLLQEQVDFRSESVLRALSGHLCRCTGYRSLKASGERVRQRLEDDGHGRQPGLDALVEAGHLPSFFASIAERLAVLHEEADYLTGELPIVEPTDRGDGAGGPLCPVAGGTDLYVQQGDELAVSPVRVLDFYPELKGIHRAPGHLHLGAMTTFEELIHHPQLLELVPDMPEYMHGVASWQIRNRATVGGNLVNASPIGDMTILLLALEAELIIRRGDDCRTQSLTTFYLGYKELELAADELVTAVQIPVRDSATQVHFEKVAKRKCLDIASVNSALRITLQEGLIAEVGLAIGGVAPIPLFLKATCQALVGRPVDDETVEEACRAAQKEISPISDVRGSADYKRLLVRQQLIAHFCRLFPQQIEVGTFL